MIFKGHNWLSKKIVDWVAHHTPRCHDITRLLSEALDHPLPWSTRVKIQLHYTICVWCERYGDQLKLIRTSARQFPEKGTPFCAKLPPERRQKIRQALRS